MAMSGTEKEMRMQTSLPYNHLIRESSSETLDHGGGSGSDPDRFSGAGVSVAPISVGSKLKPPPRYRECLKNHAANIGGNITDGCGEFMPSGDDGTLEALKCAACNCHRNFHRKEVSSPDYSRALVVNPLQLPPPLPSPSLHHHHHHHNPHGSGGRSTTPISLHAHGHANHHHWGSSINVAPVKMAFGGGGGSGATDSSSEELNFNAGGGGSAPPFSLSKKRFRTKFTQEQKDKMLEFAEKVGWRIPREDDPEVQRFCAEVGVKRQVLKVWMHNNKGSNSGKKLIQDSDDRH